MFCEKIKQVHFEIDKNTWMWPLCSKITVININDVSVRENKGMCDNLAWLQKIVLNPAFLEDVLFWDKMCG